MYVRGYLQGSENGRVVTIGFANLSEDEMEEILNETKSNL